MPSIGETLKAARLAKGVDTSTASRVIRIKQTQLEAMERDDFRTIPAPVYAKGFIRQYAQYLGLDPEPLVAAYSAMQSRGGAPAAVPSLRPAGTGPTPKPPPASPPPSAPTHSDSPSSPPPDDAPAASGLSLPEATPEPPMPPPPPPALDTTPLSAPEPRFQPVAVETGVPELLQPESAKSQPEKIPAWKDPVVMESGRLVSNPVPAGAGAPASPAFRSPESRLQKDSGNRKPAIALPPGLLRNVGIVLGSLVLLIGLFRTCGSGRPDYKSISEVPFPENPVLQEPDDPYMQSK